MPIIEARASSTADVLRAVKAIRDQWNPSREEPEEIWFRGNARRSYNLIPGLYRPQVLRFGYDEESLIRAFENLARSYTVDRPANDWEWYFLAQHFRLPTRLLDWTESTLAALYFALADYWDSLRSAPDLPDPVEPGAPPIYDDDSPTLWMLDAGTLNAYSVGKDMLFAPPKPELALYLPKRGPSPAPGALAAVKPVAIHPPRQNARIIAQQGLFTIHGDEQIPIETVAEQHDPLGTIRLARITLDRTRLWEFLDDLIVFGVGRLSLFPDLDSVAEHIRWQYRC
jgi:FRG domain